MKLRNIKVAKALGTKALAGLLVVGLTAGTPVAALADEQAADVQITEVQTENGQDQVTKIQAKSVDGTDTMTEVSDTVQAMIDNGEVRLDEESLYLVDTATGQKVDPVTGERVDSIPGTEPSTPETPTTPSTPETPTTPETPSTPETPAAPETPSTPETPAAPETPSTPETPAAPDAPAADQTQPAADGTDQNAAQQPAADNNSVTSAATNQELVSKQTLVKLPQMVENFRFWTVARKYAFAKSAINIRESIPDNVDGTNTEDAETELENAKKDAKRLKASFKKNTKKSKIEKLKANKKNTKNKTFKQARKTAVYNLETAIKKRKQLQKQGINMALANQQLTERVRVTGSVSQDGLLYILSEEKNGWLYVESGDVRGFVRASEVYTGDSAQELLNVYQKKAKKDAEKAGKEYTGIEETAKTAKERIEAKDNQAYTYLRATVNQTVVDKDYALINAQAGNGKVNVQEEMNTEAKTVGTMTQGELCYILANKDSDWVYVESGDVRGFVEKKYLNMGDGVRQQIEANGEENYQKADETVKPEENQALYYTLTSVEEGTPGGEIRQSMLEFASQFVGNPYVWGGTSLTEGADCSGFVQQIYKQYGYVLPRTAEDQSQFGTKIAVEDAQPGDLIFYAKEGHVYHVVMYAGDGKTIEAASTKEGIVQKTVNTNNAVWATRILDDNYTVAGGGIGTVNATDEMYGDKLGNFTITYYCACEICCDKADGITATGTRVVEGQTIAVDPNVIPYGTKVIIGGHVFTAEDCGGAIKQNHIDIYVNNHATALALGVANADVYLVK